MRWLRWRPSTTMVGAVCLSLCFLLPTGRETTGMPEEVFVESKIVATTGARDRVARAVPRPSAATQSYSHHTNSRACRRAGSAAGAAYVCVQDRTERIDRTTTSLPYGTACMDQIQVDVTITGDTMTVGAFPLQVRREPPSRRCCCSSSSATP